MKKEIDVQKLADYEAKLMEKGYEYGSQETKNTKSEEKDDYDDDSYELWRDERKNMGLIV